MALQRHHKIYIYKTILAIMLVSSGVMLCDIFMPMKIAEERAEGAYFQEVRGRYGGYNNYFLKTRNFTIQTDNYFYYRHLDEAPIKLFYSPIFKVVSRAEAPNSDNPQETLTCKVGNSIYNTFYFVPLAVFMLSIAGLFVKNEQADGMFVAVSGGFIAILALAIACLIWG